jgi:hypothetical protein
VGPHAWQLHALTPTLLAWQGIVPVVAVDCDAESNKKLCAEQGVRGFPTIKVRLVAQRTLATRHHMRVHRVPSALHRVEAGLLLWTGKLLFIYSLFVSCALASAARSLPSPSSNATCVRSHHLHTATDRQAFIDLSCRSSLLRRRPTPTQAASPRRRPTTTVRFAGFPSCRGPVTGQSLALPLYICMSVCQQQHRPADGQGHCDSRHGSSARRPDHSGVRGP